MLLNKAEIFSEKLCAIVGRDRARDIYFLMKYANTKLNVDVFNKKRIKKLNINPIGD